MWSLRSLSNPPNVEMSGKRLSGCLMGVANRSFHLSSGAGSAAAAYWTLAGHGDVI